MAISQTLCTVFKKALLEGEMDFSSDTSHVFKVALYTSDASLNAGTTAYSATDEVVGTGYSAGGATLSVNEPTISGTSVYVDFEDVTWAAATVTARGALIYKDGGGDPAIAVLDFGEDKIAVGNNFVLRFPIANAANAVVRII